MAKSKRKTINNDTEIKEIETDLPLIEEVEIEIEIETKEENIPVIIKKEVEKICNNCEYIKESVTISGNPCPFLRFIDSRNKIMHKFNYTKWDTSKNYCSKFKEKV